MSSPLISSELLSRAGKSSTQRFKILKHKHEVLQDEQRKKIVTNSLAAPAVQKEEMSRETLDGLIERELELLQREAAVREKEASIQERQLLSPSFKAIDREGFYKAQVSGT